MSTFLPQLETRVAISTLRIRVTGADVNYVGSVTVDAVLCDHLGLRGRQLLQIRNETTGVALWTYVIYGAAVPPGTLCLNGAAAHLVAVGDVVGLTAWARCPAGGAAPAVRHWDAVARGFAPRGAVPGRWAHRAVVDVAVGKVHRPRVSAVATLAASDEVPSVALDPSWAGDAGLVAGQEVTVVNVTTGQRDSLQLKIAEKPNDCILTLGNTGVHETKAYGSRPGYRVGDVVIVMAYASIPYPALARGSLPAMRISFPVERPADPGAEAREREVRAALSRGGGGRAEGAACEGADAHRPCVVRTPAVDAGGDARQVERYRRVWNDNGKISWGLFDNVAPRVLSPDMVTLSRRTGKGALVGANLALQAYMESKLDAIEVKSILDVGCGAGRSTLDLGLRFPDARCVGCDPSRVGIKMGIDRAEEEGVSGRVGFFAGTVQELANSNTAVPKGTFSAAWSEAALCHAPPADRAEALQAIADQLEVGGLFVLNDAVAGYAPVSAAAQRHLYERWHYSGLWTKLAYMDSLESCGLQVVEYVDLTPHLGASYAALAAEAAAAASAAGEDGAARLTYATLATEYAASAAAGLRGELGWSLFVCKKVPPQVSARESAHGAQPRVLEEKKLDT